MTITRKSARCSISAFSSAPSECRKTGWRSRSINSWCEGLDGIKYTFNNGHLAAEPKTAATNFIRALDTIPSLMATYEKEKKQFTRDIPTFEQQIAAVWPKEEELKRLKAEAESLTRKIQLDIAQKQQEMQAKTADNGNGLKIENAEVVDEVVKPSKAEPLSTASESQEEPPEEREHVVSPPESDFIRNHILLVRPATNMKAKGPKIINPISRLCRDIDYKSSH